MKNGALATKLMMAAILLTVLVYFGINLAATFADPFSTAITYGYIGENAASVTGYVVREEEVLTGTDGMVYYPRGEGEKVGVGGTVALIYENTQAFNDASTIRTLQARLEQLEYVRSLASNSQSVLRLDEEISDALIQFRGALASGSLTDAGDSGGALRACVLKRSYAYTGTASLDGSIASLQQQIDQLAASANPNTTRVAAPRSGLFSSLADGFETVLYPDMIEELTPSSFRQLSAASSASSVGKMIYGNRWYFVTVMDSSDIKELEVGDNVTLRFQKGLGRDFAMQTDFISKAENGKQVVSFTSQQHISLTTLLRHQNAQIIFESYSGFRIPRSALRIVWEEVTDKNGAPVLKEDGTVQTRQVTGVYCLWGTTARFKPVEVLWQEEDHLVVAPSDGVADSRRLRAGDEVITAAAELYDGKVVI